jgi:aldehyde dehydrogenase (NAD+)
MSLAPLNPEERNLIDGELVRAAGGATFDNIVAGADHGLGEMLAVDPRVDLVTFTGSTATGRRVMRCAAGTVKKVFLELGGKSAHIVLEDAPLPTAMASAAAVCTHAGQGCALATRLLLPR